METCFPRKTIATVVAGMTSISLNLHSVKQNYPLKRPDYWKFSAFFCQNNAKYQTYQFFLVCDVCLVCVLRARTYHDGATPTAGEAPFNTFDQSCLATMRCRRKTFLLARNSQAKCIWIHAASKPRERSKCERALVLFPKLMDFEKLQGLGREYISFGIYNAIYFGMYRFWNISTLVYIGIYNAIF